VTGLSPVCPARLGVHEMNPAVCWAALIEAPLDVIDRVRPEAGGPVVTAASAGRGQAGQRRRLRRSFGGPDGPAIDRPRLGPLVGG
jgi:hypothetical protein